MTKKLRVDQITSELEGSAFFTRKTSQPDDLRAQAATPEQLPESPRRPQRGSATRQPGASKQASLHASRLATPKGDLIDLVRRVVKTPGKEVSYVRLTPDEKTQLADIVYTFKRQGRQTSENEINRIAVNLILEDYKANGGANMLARVLEALQA